MAAASALTHHTCLNSAFLQPLRYDIHSFFHMHMVHKTHMQHSDGTWAMHCRSVLACTLWCCSHLSATAPSLGTLSASKLGPLCTKVTLLSGMSVAISAACSTPANKRDCLVQIAKGSGASRRSFSSLLFGTCADSLVRLLTRQA